MTAEPLFLTHQHFDHGAVKVSKPKVDLGENVDAWESQIADVLAQQHPWTRKVTVRVTLNAQSDEGFAVGFFHLTPREVPASAAGADRINVLTVPVIVKDFKLAPLDIFFFKGSLYPFSEERALRLLRLPDIFLEMDRDPQDLESRWNNGRKAYGGPRTIGMSGGSKFSGGELEATASSFRRACAGIVGRDHREFLKSAHALKSEALRDRVEELSGLVSTDPRWRLLVDWRVRDLDPALEQKISAVSPRAEERLCGVQVQKTSESYVVRGVYWSHPEDGAPRLDAWSPTTYHKLSRALPERCLTELMSQDWTVWNKVGEWAATSLDLGRTMSMLKESSARKKIAALHEPHRLLPHFAKTSEGKGATRADKLMFINPEKALDLPEKFEGFVVNTPVNQLLGDHRFGVLTTEGSLRMPEDRWAGGMGEMQIVPLQSSDAGADPPTTTEVRRFIPYSKIGDGAITEPKKAAVWVEDGYLFGLIFTADKITLDGETFAKAESTGYSGSTDSDILVKPQSGFTRFRADYREGAIVLHLPDDATIVEVGHNPQAAKKAKATMEAVKEAGVPITVGYEGSGWYVRNDLVEKLLPASQLNEKGVRFALCAAGIKESQVAELMQAARDYDEVTVHLQAPEIAEGAAVLKEARALAEARMDKISAFVREHPRQQILDAARTLFAAMTGTQKVSNATVGASVDMALSLGFLTPDKVMKFVDMRPDLEECLSKLCGLLLASRLGLSELPEGSLEAAVEAFEPILTGLRILEMSLHVN
jgi:hypothetical protein